MNEEVGTTQPVAESERIEALDVLRGFALLGILLLNILGFGLVSASYSNPGFDLQSGSGWDVGTWVTVELLAEGAMRCLFSMLFGAGVVLFATGPRARSAALHYRRTFWLLVFGLFDAYVLLWTGDILVNYALAGAVLYWLRNVRATRLLALAGTLLVLISLFYGGFQMAMRPLSEAAETVAAAESPDDLSSATRGMAAGWESFAGDFRLSPEEVEDELERRRAGYLSAFRWNVPQTNGMLFFVMPMFLFWDALVMMLVGMALFKMGVLEGRLSRSACWKLTLGGFATGLAINGFEVTRALRADFDLFTVFAQMQPTYHFGRLGIALGYLGLLLLWLQSDALRGLRRRLAHVGRMALTNYLMQSVIGLFLFTGAGLALVGRLDRAQLYPVVLAIWIVQLFLSDWWMRRYRFGPVEWLWRLLTYGKAPSLSR